jgi:hypothetical protein
MLMLSSSCDAVKKAIEPFPIPEVAYSDLRVAWQSGK